MVLSAALSALLQAVLLGGVPFLLYYLWQRRYRQRTFLEAARRAGLQLGDPRYLAFSLLFAAIGIAAQIAWPPPLEAISRKGTMYHSFAGAGIGPETIAAALLCGVVQTGFTEELLFRGLLAGSLSRRMSLPWAVLVQALIFLLPHLGILFVAPELWYMLPFVFVMMLLMGWVRIKSGSILGSWLIHASGNVATALLVARR